jgi:ribosomal protein S18 acetylase RimI-like enzyme
MPKEETAAAAIVVRPARPDDAPGVATCVCQAYVHYIERIGRQPAPMLDDYDAVIREAQVHVAIGDETVVGAIVMRVTAEGFYLENVSVRPAVKGRGVGRTLLELAEDEARRQGFGSIYLATHELMTENRELYSRIGYQVFEHRVVDGFARVMFRKPLP